MEEILQCTELECCGFVIVCISLGGSLFLKNDWLLDVPILRPLSALAPFNLCMDSMVLGLWTWQPSLFEN